LPICRNNDALPGLGNAAEPRQTPGPTGVEVGHACGHNLIGAGCTGAAFALKRMMRADGTSGTIRVYGCASEESQGVKVLEDSGTPVAPERVTVIGYDFSIDKELSLIHSGIPVEPNSSVARYMSSEQKDSDVPRSSQSRLICVSNRVMRPEQTESSGGLAVALRELLRERGGIWFGWSGNVSDNREKHVHIGAFTSVTLDMTQDEYEGAYMGYANSVLWPVFHNRLDLARFDRDFFDSYAAYNSRLADAIVEIAKPDDVIWVHDYHFLILGSCFGCAV
jgi:hypothetical protein